MGAYVFAALFGGVCFIGGYMVGVAHLAADLRKQLDMLEKKRGASQRLRIARRG